MQRLFTCSQTHRMDSLMCFHTTNPCGNVIKKKAQTFPQDLTRAILNIVRLVIERNRPAYLTTLMTRHVMRAAVSTQMKMTMFFRVGRCVIRDEIRDPTAASVTLFLSPSSLMTGGDVELKCVAGEDRVRGSPLTRQRATTSKVNARLCDTMVKRDDVLPVVSPR